MARAANWNTLSATEAAQRLERRELSAEALLRSCLERIAEREPQVQAFAFLDEQIAIAQAQALDRGAMRGPLHGLPIGVKDIFDTHDMPTECGSPIYRGHRPANDAACVALARRAGGVILGKTVTTEFATFTPGKTRNPHNPAHTPGGSSSGSAAAVADLMLPLALGTQTAGSVIRPAAFCGAVGYKPTYNTLPRAGVKACADSLDTVGVLARSVEDAAFFVAALAGREELRHACRDSAPPRIGVFRTPPWERVEPEARAALEQTAAKLSAAGARVKEIAPPAFFPSLHQVHATLMWYETARSLADEFLRHRELLSAALRERCEKGFAIPGEQYARAVAVACERRARLEDIFGDCEVLLAPSALGEAPAGLAATGDPVMNQAWTLLRVPCVTIPSGSGPQGLPLGVQLIGRIGEDARTLAAAHWAQQVLERGRAP